MQTNKSDINIESFAMILFRSLKMVVKVFLILEIPVKVTKGRIKQMIPKLKQKSIISRMYSLSPKDKEWF